MAKRFRALFSAIMLGALAASASAQQYPNKPIRFVVPFRRAAAMIWWRESPARRSPRASASRSLSKIGLARADKLAPNSSPERLRRLHHHHIGHAAYGAPGCGKEAPYDVLKDFTPISLLVLQPNVLVVHPDVPAQTLKDLIALAKAQPAGLTTESAPTAARRTSLPKC